MNVRMAGKSRTPRWVAAAAAALASGWILAALGPYGTFTDLSGPMRYAYWIGLNLLLWLQIVIAFVALRCWTPFSQVPFGVQAVLAALAGSVPTTFAVAYAEGLLRVGGVLTPQSMVEAYLKVSIIALAVFVPLALIDHYARRARINAASTPAGDDLPGQLASTALLAVAAEDHYLRIIRSDGGTLVHGRFSDAVRRLGDRGVQVHRSWWVARGAVERTERSGDRYVLVLRGGVRAPVSRTHLVKAREAGLLQERD